MPDECEVAMFKRDKGKIRITNEFTSPLTSPQVMNVGYGTPFKSSSQFFIRPSIPLPPSEMLTQKSILLGLGLLQTPAFENISSSQARDMQDYQRPFKSKASNPFEGRGLPPHMNTQVTGQNENRVDQPIVGMSHQTSGPSDNNQSHCAEDNCSEGSSSTCR